MQNTDHSSARRRLIKGALAASPVLMSLTSRPVMANPCSLSGFQSGNLSRTTNSEKVCATGKDPRYWATRAAWPTPYCSAPRGQNGLCDQGTPFHHPTEGFYGNEQYLAIEQRSKTMLEVLVANDSTSPGSFVVAALLNAAHFSDYVLTTEEVRKLYNEKYLTGEVSSTELRDFLRTTWEF